MDNIKNTNGELRELALFAGAGGGILGGILSGFCTVCAVEIDPYCQAVLCERQNDGLLPPFPVWDDVRTFDGRPWRGLVDVVSGGFPCQDISVANAKGKGLDGERSGLWVEMRRIIGEVWPLYALIENSPNIINKGGVRVVEDLTALGYDCRWGIVGAHHAGAPHKRARWWCLAHSNGVFGNARRAESAEPFGASGIADGGDDVSDSYGQRFQMQRDEVADGAEGIGAELLRGAMADAVHPWDRSGERGVRDVEAENGKSPGSSDDGCGEWWSTEPAVGRVAHGVANRVGQLRALGNGQVPAVVNLVWEILTEGIGDAN